ncbi:hypothetical protein D3C80_1954850 [compost metagenome]
MPVASSTQPSRTKIGTERRMMLDMPSSMRPMMTKVGMEVVKVRKDSAPRPKHKAIGTPMANNRPTPKTRKTTIFQLPK